MSSFSSPADSRWHYQCQRLANGEISRYQLGDESGLMSFNQVLQCWQQQPSFRDFYIELLASSPYSAYFWEHPPICTTQCEQPYEFVLVNSQQLVNVASDKETFSAYFNKSAVVDFQNIAGDADLVVPTPSKGTEDYADLARFSRQASAEQQHAFWLRVGSLVEEKISQQPLWLSTSGLGVYWLHIRLDSYPKYYNFLPYKKYSVADGR